MVTFIYLWRFYFFVCVRVCALFLPFRLPNMAVFVDKKKSQYFYLTLHNYFFVLLSFMIYFVFLLLYLFCIFEFFLIYLSLSIYHHSD